jgi:apolipoprotein N-acyltransferase
MGDLATEAWVDFPAKGSAPRRRGVAVAGLNWIGGALASVAAVALAAVLTIVFAATLAVVAVLSVGVVAFCALVFRGRRRSRGVLLEARRIGHSWVAYGWDQRPR